MKKGMLIGFGSIAAVAATTLLVGSYVAGKVAEGFTRTSIIQVQKQLKDVGAPATLDLLHYHRGWMHSTAMARVTFIAPDDPKIHFCIEGSTVMDHGPLVLLRGHWSEMHTQIDVSGHGGKCDILKELKASPQFVSQFDTQFGDDGPLVAKSAMKLGGITDTEVTLKPFKFTDEEGSIDLKRFTGHATLDSTGTHMRFAAKWGGIEAHFADASGSDDVDIAPVTFNGQRTRSDDYWLGPSHMLNGGVDLRGMSSQGANYHWHTNKITIDSTGAKAAEDVRGTTDVEIIENSLDGGDLGDLSVVSSISGMNLEKIAAFQKRIRMVQQRVHAAGKPATASERREIFRAFRRAFAKVDLKFKNIRYRLANSTATAQADFRFSGLANLKFDDLKSGSRQFSKMFALDASGKIEDGLVPKLAHAMAEVLLANRKISPQQLQNATDLFDQRLEGTLQMWTQRGLLVRDSSTGDYSFSANVGHGQTMVNGRPWPPAI